MANDHEEVCDRCGEPELETCPVFEGDGGVVNLCFECTTDHAQHCPVCGFYWFADCFDENEEVCNNCWLEEEDSGVDSVVTEVSDVSDVSEDDEDWIEVGH